MQYMEILQNSTIAIIYYMGCNGNYVIMYSLRLAPHCPSGHHILD